MRSLLEPAGVRRIVRGRDDATAKQLSTFFDRFGEFVPADVYEEYFGVDRSFHSRIVGMSGNRRIVAAYRTVELQIDLGRHRLALFPQRRVDQTLTEHRAIGKAIAPGVAYDHWLRSAKEDEAVSDERVVPDPSAKTKPLARWPGL